MIFFGAAELERLLPLPLLRDRMKDALRAQAEGKALSSPRHVLPLANGALGAMLGAGNGYVGGKLVCVLPGNRAAGLNPHQGIVALFDPETGRCLCVADASALTALRTAAASAAATDALARPESSVLAVTGAGEQAHRHGDAMLATRPIRILQIAARNRAGAEKLAERFRDRLEVRIFDDPKEAVRGADIVCLCTSATDSYLKLSALPRGAHVNAVGACRPGAREIDLDEGDASVFVDSVPAALEEAGELRRRFGRGQLPAEIGAVFAGRGGRNSAQEITIFKSVGIGIEDTAALALAFEKRQA